ncbi:hypothetical protein O3M35_005272 [Rhynocoris fuscipes]|uniref:Uncharacterized protein n=1 Tax=Rhynocoris fuscipes TaxID=488301 RepID=A0AAW1DHP3_9HEMI
MAYSVSYLEKMNSELSSVFDSCACEGSNGKIKLQVLIDKLSEIYGRDEISAFKESLIQIQGTSALSKSVTKDEFFTITKDVRSHTIDEISTPDRHRRIRDMKSSTPTKLNSSSCSPQNVFKDESFEIQQLSPISSNTWKQPQYGNYTLASINDSLEKKLTVAESTIYRLEEQLKIEKATNLKITKDFESLREEAKRLWNLEEQLLEANDKYKSLEVKYHAIKTELEKTKEELETLESHNTYLQNKNAALDQELKRQCLKSNKLEEFNNSFANEIITLKGTVNQVQNELSDMKNKELDLNNRIDQLICEKQELRLQLMDTDKVVTNRAMCPAYCMNTSTETTSSTTSAHYLQNTSEQNNNHQSLLSELTSLPDSNSFFGNLFDRSNSTPSNHTQKELSEVHTQTDSLEQCNVGTITDLSETPQEVKQFSENHTQTYIELSDTGVNPILPSPSEQLTSTRGVQVDLNQIPLETQSQRKANENEEKEVMTILKNDFKKMNEIEIKNNHESCDNLNSDLKRVMPLKNDNDTKFVCVDKNSNEMFGEYTETKQISLSNRSMSYKNSDESYKLAVTYDFHQIRYRNGSSDRRMAYKRGRIITRTPINKTIRTRSTLCNLKLSYYEPYKRRIYCNH